NQVTNINSKQVDQSVLEQQRRDRTLRASYTDESEIDLARDRSLQMDEAAVQALDQRKVNAQSRLENIRKSIDSHRKRDKPVPEDLSDDLKNTENEIARIEQQRAQRKNSMEA